MRTALLLPAVIKGFGGVQRFAACLHPPLAAREPVWTYRLHPAPGGSRGYALAHGLGSLWAGHRRYRFDVVISTFHWPPRPLPVPMVGTVHDLRALADAHRPWAARLVQHSILRTWALVLVPSEHVRRDVLALVPDARVSVIEEGTDHLDRFAGRAAGPRERLVVLGGRAPHKRAEMGLEVAEQVVARLGVEAVVLGPTPRRPHDPRVTVLSSPDDAQVAAAHLGARVALAPSRYEGFGLAAGEALRLGAPVVYAADGTLGSLVGGGGLPAQAHVAAMVDAVERAWADSERLSQEAHRAVRDLTWEATADRLQAAVSELDSFA
jgi:glycosyltransferase involved in cell wall biosynthesis